MTSIYLDHNATSPMLPEAADAVREASLRYSGNPASQHEPGRKARRALEEARTRIGELLGGCMHGPTADQVVLTSGGSEANNLAILGLSTSAFATTHSSEEALRSVIVISAIEHPSVSQAAAHLRSLGASVISISVDSHGQILVNDLANVLEQCSSDSPVRLASITLANSETGVLQPIAAAARHCRQQHVALHTDATQAVGKCDVHFGQLGVTAMTCAAHKFGGPLGIGALMVRGDASLTPQLYGGFQQSGRRPGTETTALAIGMRTALEYWREDAARRREELASLRNLLEQQISAGYPEAVVIGVGAERLPNTSNIGLPGIDRQELAMALDVAGIACSTGSACASGSSEPSRVHVAMRVDEAAAQGAMRFSLGPTTTKAEILQAAELIVNACKRLRRDI